MAADAAAALARADAVDEAAFYFYNLQPVGNPCPLDQTGPDTIHATAEYPAEDAVYVTSLLAEPAACGSMLARSSGSAHRPRAPQGPWRRTTALHGAVC